MTALRWPALALAAALLTAPALGQQLGPAPPVPDPEEGPPAQQPAPGDAEQAAPDQDAPAPAAPPQAPAPALRGAGIVVGELAEVDPSVIGLLDESQGGLGIAMWAGSDRRRIERLLPRLPMGTLSPTVQNLSRRLLLSTAAVPEGDPVAPSLLGLRVERLMAGGFIEDVNELLRVAATGIEDPALARAAIDAMLLAGDNLGACQRVLSLVRGDPRPYWTKTLAFCRALDNDGAAVSLAVALLRDQGQAADEVFFSLISLLTGGSGEVTSLIDPTPLHLAMLRAARLAVPADAVGGARPAILWAIATAPNDSFDVRLEAAERAEAAGALDTGILAAIYAAIPYTQEEIDGALEAAAEADGSRVSALLFQAAQVWESPPRRAAALRRSLEEAREGGAGFGTAARVGLPTVRDLAPAADLMAAADDLVRALLVAGEVEGAWAWLDMATAEADGGDAEAAAVAAGVWPLLQLADPEGAFMRDAGRARTWWKDLPATGGDPNAGARRGLLFTAFEALGTALPAEAWDPLFAGPLTVAAYAPSPAVTRALGAASAAGRVGETVLLALLALGEVGPEGAEPGVLFDVLGALRRVGLAAEARSIALEAVLAQGV